MRIGIITSHRSVSLQRVASDIAEVLYEHGYTAIQFVDYPIFHEEFYRRFDAAITVMTFDTFWATPYFLFCRDLRARGVPCIFYTTIEGDPIRHHGDEWIYRDLSYVANSRYTARKLEAAGAIVTDVVPHGIFTEKIRAFKYMRRKIREFLGIKDDEVMVLYVAGAYMRKGHDLFGEACRILQRLDPRIKVVVLTQPDALGHYDGAQNTTVLTDFGKLGEDMVYGLYHACDIYVQASLSEGFGLPVLEALAAGKVVVHPSYEPLTEITTEKTSFRVPVKGVMRKRDVGGIVFELHIYDPEEMAKAIVEAKNAVLEQRDEYEARCIERAKEFEAPRVYSRLIDELESWGYIHV